MERTLRRGGDPRPSPLAALLSQRFQLVHELVNVFEFAVDRGKTNIGDLVQLMKLFHQFFAHNPALNFGFTHFLDTLLNAIRDRFDGGGNVLAALLRCSLASSTMLSLLMPVAPAASRAREHRSN